MALGPTVTDIEDVLDPFSLSMATSYNKSSFCAWISKALRLYDLQNPSPGMADLRILGQDPLRRHRGLGLMS